MPLHPHAARIGWVDEERQPDVSPESLRPRLPPVSHVDERRQLARVDGRVGVGFRPFSALPCCYLLSLLVLWVGENVGRLASKRPDSRLLWLLVTWLPWWWDRQWLPPNQPAAAVVQAALVERT